jgi:hypothetical protein
MVCLCFEFLLPYLFSDVPIKIVKHLVQFFHNGFYRLVGFLHGISVRYGQTVFPGLNGLLYNDSGMSVKV